MFKSYKGFFSPLMSIGNWFLVKGAKYINDLSPNVFENLSFHIILYIFKVCVKVSV